MVALVVALGILVFVKVIPALDKHTLFAVTVKLAVGAGVLLTATVKVELLIDVPHALFA